MTRSRSATYVALTIALLATAMLPAKGDEAGVSEDAVLFGQAAALEGPSSALGQRMRQGIVVAFTESALGYGMLAVAAIMMTVGGLWLKSTVKIRF